jgi:hypothetical protein
LASVPLALMTCPHTICLTGSSTFLRLMVVYVCAPLATIC